MDAIHYQIGSSKFGSFALAWRLYEDRPRVRRIFLPRERSSMEAALTSAFPQVMEGFHPEMDNLLRSIERFLGGEDIRFDLNWLGWGNCTDFQARVLRVESGIPRGWVSTYGRIARELGVPGGGRAVGGALAANPFPLVIPCHRAIRSTGALGGFQGGLEMKKALLEMEGVVFQTPTKVSLNKVYY